MITVKINLSKVEIERMWLLSQETGAELKEPAIYTFALLLSSRLSKHLDDVKVALTD